MLLRADLVTIGQENLVSTKAASEYQKSGRRGGWEGEPARRLLRPLSDSSGGEAKTSQGFDRL